MKKPSATKVEPSKGTGKVKRRGPVRGTLWIIALLLATSGILRLNGSGRALARELISPAGADQMESTAEPQICKNEADITLVLDRLREREASLEAREGAIADRMQALAVAEAEVKENLAALIAAEERLRATMALADSAAENDLTRLTAVYENMKAKEAAALFETMDPQFAAGFLGRMRPETAASIMAGLKPETAYTISVVLAGRNANVPTN